MNCPKCSSLLEAITFEQIEIDRCTSCQGIWFDSKELEKLKDIKGAEIIDIGDPKVGKGFNKLEKVDCPLCRTQMVRMVASEKPYIWYESCPVCYGAFLDAGEFSDYKQKKLIHIFRALLTKARK